MKLQNVSYVSRFNPLIGRLKNHDADHFSSAPVGSSIPHSRLKTLQRQGITKTLFAVSIPIGRLKTLGWGGDNDPDR